MPPISVIFIATITAGFAVSAEAPEPRACRPRVLKTYALLGPVKSVRVESAEADGQRVLTAKYVFDRKGRLLEDWHTVSTNAPERLRYQVFRSHYEPKGHDYEIDAFEIEPALGEKPIDLQRHLIKFDSRGRCIEERDIDSDGESSRKVTYAYDSRGDLIREIERNSGDSIFSIENRAYRPDHKLLSEKAIENRRGQGLSYQWSREYRYDARGNQTDMFSYQQGVLEAHWIDTYDERNRLTSSQTIVTDPQKDQPVYGKCFDCGLSSGETIYQYDHAGHLTEMQFFQPGRKLVSVEKYRYDAHGNRLPSPDDIYLYDSRGNWIEEIPPDQTSGEIRYRVIEYY